MCKMIYLLMLAYTTAAVTTRIQVYMNSSSTGIIGNSTTLSCHYRYTDNSNIRSVEILARYRNADFNPIVTFRPDRAAALSSYGAHLKNRVVLSNITASSREATITIENMTCNDEGSYICNITYSKGTLKYTSSNRENLSIIVEPSDPEDILAYNLLSDKQLNLQSDSVVEGENITFICRGNVGRPKGKLLWQQFLDNSIVRNLTDEDPQLYELNDSCIYYQRTNVTIELSLKDHRTKMRCGVYSPLSQQEMYRETPEMDVLYKVREAYISIEPFRYTYKEGTSQIKLTCKTDGNPQPQYLWYKRDNLSELFLSTNSTYIITNARVGESGLYVCKVNNSFRNQSYEAETTENIIIVKDDLNMSDLNPNSTFAKRDLIIGFATMGCTISGTLIVVVLFFYKRKRLPKQNDSLNAVELPANQSCNPYYFSAYASVDIGFGGYSEKNNEMRAINKTFSGESNSIQEHNVENHDDTQTAPVKYEYASVNETTQMKNRITQNEGACREDIHAKLDQNVYDVTHSNTVAKEASEGQQNQHIYDESYAGEYALLQHNRPREPTTCNTIYDKAQVTSLPKEDNCD